MPTRIEEVKGRHKLGIIITQRLLAHILTYSFTQSLSYLVLSLLTYLFSYLFTHSLGYLVISILTYLFAYLLTYLLTYLFAYYLLT